MSRSRCGVWRGSPTLPGSTASSPRRTRSSPCARLSGARASSSSRPASALRPRPTPTRSASPRRQRPSAAAQTSSSSAAPSSTPPTPDGQPAPSSKRWSMVEYHKQGSGPAFVYVCGIEGSGKLFYKQADDLARDHTVVSFPLRRDGRYGMERLVEDLAWVIREAGARATVLGESFGGLLTMATALA